MSYQDNILACKKSYYNAARQFNSVQSYSENVFDLLHDAIILTLEENINIEKSINRIKSKARLGKNHKYKDLICDFKFKQGKRVAGWNKKACEYFEKVNRLLIKNGLPIGKHAMNGGEKQFSCYSVDFYIPGYEIIVEYNEPAHYNSKWKINQDYYRKKYLEIITDLPVITVHEGKQSHLWCYREILRNIELYKCKHYEDYV